MIDQANKLRDLVKQNKEETQKSATLNEASNENPALSALESAKLLSGTTSARVLTITSGKGGVGKTNFTINLGISLAKQGKRVVILDADFGLANIDVLFGIIPRYSFADVLNGTKSIKDALTEGPNGIKFVSGGSGLHELANIGDTQMVHILEGFQTLDEIADIVLIDTGAGISKSVMNFIKASTETIIVTTPEPTSITDAYAIIKTAREDGMNNKTFKVVVNRVDDSTEGQEVFRKLNMVSERFLSISLSSLGFIPTDALLVKAVKKQQPVSTCFPNALSTKSIELICNKLLNEKIEINMPKDGIKSFMKRLVKIFGS